MTPVLIIKTGDKLDSLAHVPGDFEHWIAAAMGLAPAQWRAVAVHRGEGLPPPSKVGAALVTGSAAMVTDASPWIERSAAWLRSAVGDRLPVLGICFGHQLLAHALGGQVGDNPAGVEVGTVEVRRLGGPKDALFDALPPTFLAQVSHRQAVLRLPPGARHLAATARDARHAFAVGESAWGVQFHPEFDAAIVAAYVRHYRERLTQQGDDPQRVLEQCRETPAATGILQTFAQRLATVA